MAKQTTRKILLRCQAAVLVLLSAACSGGGPTGNSSSSPGMEVTFLVGSAMGDFCQQSMERFNQTGPKLKDGSSFSVKCVAKGSGDIVSELLTQANALKMAVFRRKIRVGRPWFLWMATFTLTS